MTRHGLLAWAQRAREASTRYSTVVFCRKGVTMCEQCTRRQFLGAGVAGGLMLAGAPWTHARAAEAPPPRPRNKSRICVVFTGNPQPVDRNWGADSKQIAAMKTRLAEAEKALGNIELLIGESRSPQQTKALLDRSGPDAPVLAINVQNFAMTRVIGPVGNSEEAFQRMELLKKERKRSVPKLNYPSPILYVGSSTTSITSRIKQHIGYGHPGTYALNLIHWLEGHYKITVREYELGRSALQIVEDALSHELAPAFGKMGGNSR